MLEYAGSAEKGSEHPLAEAILMKAESDKARINQADNFEALPGRGVQCSVGNRKVLLGNRTLMQEKGVSLGEAESDLASLETEGKIVMILAVDGKNVGLIAAMDTPKERAAEAVEQLKDLKLEVAILAGDNGRTDRGNRRPARNNASVR